MTLQQAFKLCFEGGAPDPNQVWSKLGTYNLMDVFEINSDLGKFASFDYPLLFILPIIDDANQELSGLWSSANRLQGYICFRTEQHINDQDKMQLEPQMLELRVLLKKFANRLNTLDVVDKLKPIKRIISTPFYGDFDEHVHGYSVQIYGNFIETKSNCTT